MLELAWDKVSPKVLLRTSLINDGPADSTSVEVLREGKFDLLLNIFLKLPKILYKIQ